MEIKKRQSEDVVRKRHIKIAKDYNGGMPVKDIARLNDVSVATVYYALKQVENYDVEEENL